MTERPGGNSSSTSPQRGPPTTTAGGGGGGAEPGTPTRPGAVRGGASGTSPGGSLPPRPPTFRRAGSASAASYAAADARRAGQASGSGGGGRGSGRGSGGGCGGGVTACVSGGGRNDSALASRFDEDDEYDPSIAGDDVGDAGGGTFGSSSKQQPRPPRRINTEDEALDRIGKCVGELHKMSLQMAEELEIQARRGTGRVLYVSDNRFMMSGGRN